MSVDDGTGSPPPLSPRHQAPEPSWLVSPPIPVAADGATALADPADLTSLRRWNAALSDRIGATRRTLTGLTTVLLVLAIAFACLLYRQSERTSDLDSARVADTAHQLTVNTQLRTALCDTDTALMGGYNVTSRRVWPAGPDAYDQTTQKLRRATQALRCPD